MGLNKEIERRGFVISPLVKKSPSLEKAPFFNQLNLCNLLLNQCNHKERKRSLLSGKYT
jgi:hypothetical protein